MMLFRSSGTAIGVNAIAGERRIVVSSMLGIGKLRIKKWFEDGS
jgi:hypothetical protein